MKIQINGKAQDVDVSADTPLLWVLRDELKLTGTKFGCGAALCAALAGGGLVAGFGVPVAGRFGDAAAQSAAGRALQPNVFVRVTPDTWVTVTIGHTEMRQGVSTIIPMLVAEELDADWSRVRWEQAPTEPAFAHPMMHTQLTGGSLTTTAQFMPQRQAGAGVRACWSRRRQSAGASTPRACAQRTAA